MNNKKTEQELQEIEQELQEIEKMYSTVYSEKIKHTAFAENIDAKRKDLWDDFRRLFIPYTNSMLALGIKFSYNHTEQLKNRLTELEKLNEEELKNIKSQIEKLKKMESSMEELFKSWEKEIKIFKGVTEKIRNEKGNDLGILYQDHSTNMKSRTEIFLEKATKLTSSYDNNSALLAEHKEITNEVDEAISEILKRKQEPQVNINNLAQNSTSSSSKIDNNQRVASADHNRKASATSTRREPSAKSKQQSL